MAEYLSPGVYVEEFDTGVKAMEGVGTSTAGFIGMAQKGPVSGLPVLVTSMADYRRRFGGYLSERIYGGQRFLPYAVEQFFNNGGASCYVMRVCGEEKNGEADEGDSAANIDDGGSAEESGGGESSAVSRASGSLGEFLTLKAASPGAWGNQLQARFTLAVKNRVKISEMSADEKRICKVDNAAGYRAGDLVCIQECTKEKTYYYDIIETVEGNTFTLKGGQQAPEAGEDTSEAGEDVSKAGEDTSEAGEDASEAGQDDGKQKPQYLYLAEWNLSVSDNTASEQYESISFHPARSNYAAHVLEKSQLICAELQADKIDGGGLMALVSGGGEEPYMDVVFTGGDDGEIKYDASLYLGKDGSPDKRTGLMAFQTLQDVNIMAIPGITDAVVQSALVSHCENSGDRFAVLDMPLDTKEVSDLQEFRENIDTSYAAMYHPWLLCYDSLINKSVYMPPSGAVAGIYARTDTERGVHKAPANEIVRGCTGLSVKYNEAEQAKLNPRGINLIRALPGQGIRVWGARTCSSDGNWKYVNVRRLFLYIEQSIKVNTNWAVFEPNDELLWSRVEGTIRVFLTTLWRNGALTGSAADEAFYISIGRTTMTEDDILNGRLICEIGVAPVRPAEFVVFRITQKMESAQ